MLLSTAVLIVLASAPVAANAGRYGKIVFASDRDANSEIYVMNADGTGQTRITHNSGSDHAPKWSPDGKRIAFISYRPSGNNIICVMNADGSGLAEITPISGSVLTWSPDGREIAFEHNSVTTGLDILAVSVESGRRRVIAGGPELDHSPAWSPDGSKILFSRYLYGIPSGSVLHTIRPDGTGITALPNGFADGFDDFLAAWSPDGGSIVFSVNVWDFWDSIFVANADGTSRRFFHGCEVINCGTNSSYAGWAPDGRKIVFEIYDHFRTEIEIYVKNTDRTGLTQLTNSPGSNWGASWQSFPKRVDVGVD